MKRDHEKIDLAVVASNRDHDPEVGTRLKPLFRHGVMNSGLSTEDFLKLILDLQVRFMKVAEPVDDRQMSIVI